MKIAIAGRKSFVRSALIFSMVLMTSRVLFGQNNMGEENFHRLVDYVNAEISLRYLETLNDPEDKINYQKIKEHLPPNSIKSPVNFDTLAFQLDAFNFKKTLSGLSLIINGRKLFYESFLSDFDLISIIFETHDISQFLLDQIGGILQDALSKVLKAYQNTANINDLVEDVNISQHDEKVIKETNRIRAKVSKGYPNGFYNVYIFFGVILFLTIIFILLHFFRIRYYKAVFVDRERDLKAKHLKELTSMRGTLRNQYDRQIQVQLDEIKYLKNEIEELNRRIKSQTSKNIDPIIEEVRRPVDNSFFFKKPHMGRDNKIFYMGAPASDGTFVEARKHSQKTSMSMYKFEELDSYTSKFWFDGDETSTNDAIRTPHIYLEPVCVLENKEFPSAKRLRTVKEGIVQLAGDQWKCLQKAILRYE